MTLLTFTVRFTRRGLEADDWPGYGDVIHSIDLPVWALNETGALL